LTKPLTILFKTFFVLIALVSLASCRDDFEPERSTGNLEFSRDTVYLDTVFSNIGSSTYTLKVFNRSDAFIRIPQVGLARGENSAYRLNIDGRAGKVFTEVEILPKDSIFIFIETTVDAQNNDQIIYTDQIIFDAEPYTQQVELVTLVQDAEFLFPRKNAQGIKETLQIGIDEAGEPILIEGFVLADEQLHFTNEKPYVIYGYAGIADGKTLILDAGARLHFHDNSGIIVGNGGRLEANGSLSADPETLENEIILEGDRLEPEFADVPGQWGTLWFTPGSTGILNYITIKNNNLGILADGNTGNAEADIQLKNTQIYNSALVGVYAITASLNAENLVVGNSGISNLWIRLGGSYSFTHSTFANYWNQSFRNTPAVQVDNFLETEAELLTADLTKADFVNCIIYGNRAEELGLRSVDENAFNFSFSNSLIRFDDRFGEFSALPNYDFTDATKYEMNTISADPDFENTAKNKYRIGLNSAAQELGNTAGAVKVPLDITGAERNNTPDAGAYQATNLDN